MSASQPPLTRIWTVAAAGVVGTVGTAGVVDVVDVVVRET